MSIVLWNVSQFELRLVLSYIEDHGAPPRTGDSYVHTASLKFSGLKLFANVIGRVNKGNTFGDTLCKAKNFSTYNIACGKTKEVEYG